MTVAATAVRAGACYLSPLPLGCLTTLVRSSPAFFCAPRTVAMGAAAPPPPAVACTTAVGKRTASRKHLPPASSPVPPPPPHGSTTVPARRPCRRRSSAAAATAIGHRTSAAAEHRGGEGSPAPRRCDHPRAVDRVAGGRAPPVAHPHLRGRRWRRGQPPAPKRSATAAAAAAAAATTAASVAAATAAAVSVATTADGRGRGGRCRRYFHRRRRGGGHEEPRGVEYRQYHSRIGTPPAQSCGLQRGPPRPPQLLPKQGPAELSLQLTVGTADQSREQRDNRTQFVGARVPRSVQFKLDGNKIIPPTHPAPPPYTHSPNPAAPHPRSHPVLRYTTTVSPLAGLVPTWFGDHARSILASNDRDLFGPFLRVLPGRGAQIGWQ